MGSAPRWSTDGPRRLGADPSARRATLEVGMAQTLPPAPPGGRGMQGTRVLFGCGLSIMDEACGPRPGELHCRQCDVEAVTDDQVLPMYILLPQRAWAGDPHGASGRRRGDRAAVRCTSTRKPAALGRALARARGHRSPPHPQIQCCSPSRLVYLQISKKHITPVKHPLLVDVTTSAAGSPLFGDHRRAVDVRSGSAHGLAVCRLLAYEVWASAQERKHRTRKKPREETLGISPSRRPSNSERCFKAGGPLSPRGSVGKALKRRKGRARTRGMKGRLTPAGSAGRALKRRTGQSVYTRNEGADATQPTRGPAPRSGSHPSCHWTRNLQGAPCPVPHPFSRRLSG